MTDEEQKVLALLNEVAKEMSLARYHALDLDLPSYRALLRAIEQHEAFRQKVSDAVEAVKSLWGARDWPSNDKFEALSSFIITKPDPLDKALELLGWKYDGMVRPATALRAELDWLGYEIREKAGD